MSIETIRKKNLQEMEDTLRYIGAEKCKICNFWVSKEYINKNNICIDCIPTV